MKSKIYDCDKDPALIKPSDLLEIQPKELVYEGFTYGCNATHNIFSKVIYLI